jgi:hypothetical protein
LAENYPALAEIYPTFNFQFLQSESKWLTFNMVFATEEFTTKRTKGSRTNKSNNNEY